VETKRIRQGVGTRCGDKVLARSTHLNPLLTSLLIGTLKPPAYSSAFDKVTEKARDKVDASPEGARYTSPEQRPGEWG